MSASAMKALKIFDARSGIEDHRLLIGADNVAFPQ
jgi:hypothetical protein